MRKSILDAALAERERQGGCSCDACRTSRVQPLARVIIQAAIDSLIEELSREGVSDWDKSLWGSGSWTFGKVQYGMISEEELQSARDSTYEALTGEELRERHRPRPWEDHQGAGETTLSPAVNAVWLARQRTDCPCEACCERFARAGLQATVQSLPGSTDKATLTWEGPRGRRVVRVPREALLAALTLQMPA